MKKGICITAIYPETVNNYSLLMEALKKTAEEKIFDCVELYFKGTEKEEQKIGDELEKLGLSLVFLGGFLMKKDKVDISSCIESKRRESVEICKKLYKSACRMHAKKMLILSGPSWKVRDEQRLIQQTRKSLTELTEDIDEKNPELTLEYFNDQGEPWLAVGDINMVRRIFEEMDDTHLGITFDTSHTIQMNRDILRSFRILQPWIRHLHLANSVSMNSQSPLFGDKHPLFDVEEGDISLEEIKRLYTEMKHQGLLEKVDICSIEVISRGREDEYYQRICEQANYIWN